MDSDEGPRPVVDPHHAIRAGGITYAIVRCGPDCPPEHGWVPPEDNDGKSS